MHDFESHASLSFGCSDIYIFSVQYLGICEQLKLTHSMKKLLLAILFGIMGFAANANTILYH